MKSNPLVSVIVNSFNSEKFLKEAIDSIYSQSYTNWEIIFWDNCSIDNTSKIAKSYDNKLLYFRGKENVPLYKARNYALEKCNGKYIAFLDSDDIWLPNKTEIQVKKLEDGFKIVYGGYKLIDTYGEDINVVENCALQGRITNHLLNKNSISIGSVMIDSDLLKEYKFDSNYNLLGDFDLWIRLSLKHDIACVEDIVELSRVHDSNESDVDVKKWKKERRHFYKKFLLNKNLYKYPNIIKYIIKTELKGLKNVR